MQRYGAFRRLYGGDCGLPVTDAGYSAGASRRVLCQPCDRESTDCVYEKFIPGGFAIRPIWVSDYA